MLCRSLRCKVYDPLRWNFSSINFTMLSLDAYMNTDKYSCLTEGKHRHHHRRCYTCDIEFASSLASTISRTEILLTCCVFFSASDIACETNIAIDVLRWKLIFESTHWAFDALLKTSASRKFINETTNCDLRLRRLFIQFKWRWTFFSSSETIDNASIEQRVSKHKFKSNCYHSRISRLDNLFSFHYVSVDSKNSNNGITVATVQKKLLPVLKRRDRKRNSMSLIKYCNFFDSLPY